MYSDLLVLVNVIHCNLSPMQGVYVNIDTFKSKLRLLASRFEPEFAVKNVLNQDNGGYTEYV